MSTREYNIVGTYPDEALFFATVETSCREDAFALAQGLLKVTTVRAVSVYDAETADMVFQQYAPRKI